MWSTTHFKPPTLDKKDKNENIDRQISNFCDIIMYMENTPFCVCFGCIYYTTKGGVFQFFKGTFSLKYQKE